MMADMKKLRPATVRVDEGYLRAPAAAEFLGVSLGTLAQWRHHKRYPIPFIRIGRGERGGRCFYRKRDLVKFMESRPEASRSTASRPEAGLLRYMESRRVSAEAELR
jgi:hypothetical protein